MRYFACLAGALLFFCLAETAAAQDPTILGEYERMRSGTRDDDVKGLLSIAEWCEEHDLARKKEECLEQVLKLQSDNKKARAGLGYELVDKQWQKTKKRLFLEEVREIVSKKVKFAYSKKAEQLKTDGDTQVIKTLGILIDPELWVSALIRINDVTKYSLNNVELTVYFDYKDKRSAIFAQGFGSMGRGTVTVNLDTADRYLEGVEKVYNLKDLYGNKIKIWHIPFIIKNVIVHELTHTFVNMLQTGWLTEGFASYMQFDEYHIKVFKWRKYKLVRLDKVKDDEEIYWYYGRGNLFFLYIEREFGKDAVTSLIQRLKLQPYPQAVEAATGLKWEEVLRKELQWSRSYLSKITIKVR